LVGEAWACAGGEEAEVGGDDEGVALVVGLVAGTAVTMPPVATAAARDELGGETTSVGWLVAGGVGVAPWARVLAGMFWHTEVASEEVAAREILVKLWLLQGGAALCWAGVPAGMSTSMGEVSAGGIVDAAAAYKWGAAVVGVAAASWKTEGGSMSMGVEEICLVHLEVGGLQLVGEGPRKGKNLPSLLEGIAFQPGAMVERKVQPEMLKVWCDSQERALVVYCWQVLCAYFARSELKGGAMLLSGVGGPSC